MGMLMAIGNIFGLLIYAVQATKRHNRRGAAGMRLRFTIPRATAMRTEQASADSTRLRGRPLLAARAIWLIIAIFSESLFVAGIPAQVVLLQTICPTEVCATSQLDPAGMQALHAAGLSLGFYAAYTVALNVAVTTVFALVGILLFWRRSDDRLALLASIALLTFGVSSFTGALEPLALLHPFFRLPVAAVSFLGSATFILVLYVFPDAHFVPSAMLWVALVSLVEQFPHYFFPFSPLDMRTWPVPLQLAIPVALLGTIVFSQLYRYRRVSTTVQREQTKWVVLGITLGLGGFVAVLIVLNIFIPAASRGAVAIAVLVGSAVEDAFVL